MSEQVLKQILSELQSLSSQMNHRFDAVETRLGNVENQLGNVETRLGNVETRLANVEGKMGTIHHQAVTNTEKLTGHTGSQARLEKVLMTLSVRSLEQETDIQQLKQIK